MCVYKKLFFLSLFSIVINTTTYCQNENDNQKFSGLVLGSFIHNKIAYNYEYSETDESKVKLIIEQVTNTEDVVVAKYKKFVLDSIPKLSSLLLKINPPFSIDELRLSENLKSINTDEEMKVAVKAINILDSLLKLKALDSSFIRGDSLSVIQSQKLLELLKTNLSGENLKFKETGKQEIVLNDMTTDQIKSFFHASLPMLDPTSTKVEDFKDIDELALRVFYEIEARRKFLDDEPSTAYLKLRSEIINAYIDNLEITETIDEKQYQSRKNEFIESISQDKSDEEKEAIVKKEFENKYKKRKINEEEVYLKKQDITLPIKLRISNAQFEFESGTIKNIIAVFDIYNSKIVKQIDFRNNKPIPVSGKFHGGIFFKHNIYSFYDVHPTRENQAFLNSFELSQLVKEHNPSFELSDKRSRDEKEDIFINLGEFVRYIPILESNKEDFSPADKEYIISLQQPTVELKKIRRSKIINVKAFSDFIGTDINQPNGLIQFEANLKANFLTSRFQKLIGIHSDYAYTGFLINTQINYYRSKIEEKNRYLVLSQIDSFALSKNKKVLNARAVDLVQYRNDGIDISSTLFRQNLPQLTSSFLINGSFGILRTSVSDSLTVANNQTIKNELPNNRFITSLISSLDIAYDFSDSRYGYQVGYRRTWITTKNDEVGRYKDLKNQMNTIFFEGFYATSESTRIFGRWRFNMQSGNPNYHFHQVQLGYAVDLFKVNN